MKNWPYDSGYLLAIRPNGCCYLVNVSPDSQMPTCATAINPQLCRHLLMLHRRGEKQWRIWRERDRRNISRVHTPAAHQKLKKVVLGLQLSADVGATVHGLATEGVISPDRVLPLSIGCMYLGTKTKAITGISLD